MRKRLMSLAALAALACAPAGAGHAKPPESQQVVTDMEVVYYPSGWKSQTRDINLGLNFYKNWTPQTNPTYPVRYDDMPAESLDWAAILLHREYLVDEHGRKATVADKVAIKNCAVAKCADSDKCPVHKGGRVPVNRLSKSCPGTVKEWPEWGMYCGRYYKREESHGTFIYYFDNYGPEPRDGKARYAEVTAMYSFKDRVYTAQLLTSASRVKKYLPYLEFVIKGIRAKKGSQD